MVRNEVAWEVDQQREYQPIGAHSVTKRGNTPPLLKPLVVLNEQEGKSFIVQICSIIPQLPSLQAVQNWALAQL